MILQICGDRIKSMKRSDSKRRPMGVVHNQKGIALLAVMFFFMFVVTLITEVSYETTLEYAISSRVVHDLKARSAAKAGLELSLLRIHIYKQVIAQFGDKLGSNASMLDVIWQFPFVWPPVFPDNVGRAHKEAIEKVVRESKMKARYLPTISSEGAKIDINDVASPAEGLAKATQKMILQIFEEYLKSNDEVERRLAGIDFQKIVNNIVDWVDEDKERIEGGVESALYPKSEGDFIPPNQPFKTLDELHMVSGMTDELFELLAPRITVYGNKGVNINYADKDMLKSLSSSMTDEAVTEVMKRRSDPNLGGPFKDEKDFFAFVKQYGVDEEAFKDLPLLFDTEYNFVIRSTGEFGQVTREIVAIVYDFDRVTERLHGILDKESDSKNQDSEKPNDQDGGKSDGKEGDKSKKQKVSVPKGRPRVVYWFET